MMVSCCDDSDEPRIDYNTEAPEQLSIPVPVTKRSDDNERKPDVLGKRTSVTHCYSTVETRSYETAVRSIRFAINLQNPDQFGSTHTHTHMYVCAYVCVYIYVYIYTHTHIYLTGALYVHPL